MSHTPLVASYSDRVLECFTSHNKSDLATESGIVCQAMFLPGIFYITHHLSLLRSQHQLGPGMRDLPCSLCPATPSMLLPSGYR